MPEVCFLNGNSTNLDPKKSFNEFGDETLKQMLKNARPDVNKNNSYLIIGDEIIQDWTIPIGICKLLGENVLIFNLPYKTIKFNLENNKSHEFYVPPDMKFGDLASMIKNTTRLSPNLNYIEKSQPIHEVFKENKIKIQGTSPIQVFYLNLDGITKVLKTNRMETIKIIKLKIKNIEGIHEDYQRLIFSGKELEDSRSLSYYDIRNESTLYLNLKLRGGEPELDGRMMFVDLYSNNGPKKIAWAKSAPKWRKSAKGLCLEGKCQNNKCEAFDQMVVVIMGNDIDYQLGLPYKETNCPMCDEHVNPETCALNNCEWRCFGVKREKSGKPIEFKTDWQICDNNYYRFDPIENGICEYTYLVIECRSIEIDNLKKKTIPCSTATKEHAEKIVNHFQNGIMKDFEICSICFEKYNDNNHLSLMLPCQHSFCSGCLSRLYKNSSTEDQIKCPDCEKIHIIKLRSLPRNRFIL